MALVDTLAEKVQKSTVSITAGRGRGKSASIGLSLAAAIQMGYSNIFVTAPSPDNLKTLFDFVCTGLELLDYKERQDFDRVYSTNKDYDKATIRIDIFKHHTQFIQFVFPNDADKIGHTDLVVID
jgi:N-acetyltransferase 10